MAGDPDSPIVSVEPGDPVNDQMLAQAKEDLRGVLDVTIHPIIEQAEAQGAGLSEMMAALVFHWCSEEQRKEENMPRERMASLLALALFFLAEQEREIIANEKTVVLDEVGLRRAAEILVRRGKAKLKMHASPNCACGVNEAGDPYIDPICMGLPTLKEMWQAKGSPCYDPQCNDSTWDHPCPTPPPGVNDD